MKKLKAFFVVLFFSINVYPILIASPPNINNKSKEEITKEINAYLQLQEKLHNFCGSALITREDKILFQGNFGMADWGKSIPNTAKTKFWIASVSKQFTSMAIMQLHEKGLLDINAPITKYLSKDYPNKDRSNVEKDGVCVSVYHLLTHTSGIPEFHLQSSKVYSSLEGIIGEYKNASLETIPGEKFCYRNSGYLILTYIIEKVSQKSYDQYIKEHIFDPLGMHDSGCCGKTAKENNNFATGYKFDFMEEKYKQSKKSNINFPNGESGIYSTIEDLHAWSQALCKSNLANKNLLNKTFTPFLGDYGCGWFVEKRFGRLCLNHSGTGYGFRAHISRYPDENLCIIFLLNVATTECEKIGRDLAAIIFNERYDQPQKKKTMKLNINLLKKYAGKYKSESCDQIIEVILLGNDLFLKELVGDTNKFKMCPKTENDFFLIDYPETQISFNEDKLTGILDLTMNNSHTTAFTVL